MCRTWLDASLYLLFIGSLLLWTLFYLLNKSMFYMHMRGLVTYCITWPLHSTPFICGLQNRPISTQEQTRGIISTIDVKTFFYVFNFGHVFYVFNVFLIFQTFFILKNDGKVQSGMQINKKHFQNNSNEIDLWFFFLFICFWKLWEMCRVELQAPAGIWNSLGS